MPSALTLRSAVAALRKCYGEPPRPISRDPFHLILWEQVAYLKPDVQRRAAFLTLRKEVGLEPMEILAAARTTLARITRLGGGIAADTRAVRMHESAELVVGKWDGDLGRALRLPEQQARRALGEFPMIGEPGADKILAIAGKARTLPMDSNEIESLESGVTQNKTMAVPGPADSEKAGGGKVSVNDMVIKAAAVALKQVPEANASYTPEGIAMHHHADIAMAVAVPHGLITPIIRAAETKGLAQIAAEAKDLAERARTKKLKPEEYLGGTFSVSNLGMFGVRSFGSIINEPQGCILSVGIGDKRPVVRGDELAVATVMSVTLTCDHRVVDGATGARWLQAFKQLLEDPITMIV